MSSDPVPSPSAAGLPEPLAVLIVEDSPADAELSIRALRSAGFSVEADVAGTREGFEQALKARTHDVVLCDHGLPGWDSFEVLARVRQTSDAPFIVVTGTIGEEQAVECVKLGATDSVLKGHLARLPIAVRRALSEVKHQRERNAAELRFSKAFHANPIPMTISTLADGRLVEVNDSFVRVFGYPREEVIGQRSTDVGIWRSLEDRSAMIAKLRAEGNLRELELNLRTKSGGLLNGNYSAEVIAIGSAPHILAMFQDLTERRRVEEQLRQSQKMEAVGRLAGGVAHDFNNVLTAITGYCALLEMDMEGDPRIADVQEIRKAGERAAALTRQLLAISRRQVLQPVVLDVNALVRNIQNMLSRTIGDNIQLETLLSSDTGAVRGDPGQLEQVLLNLAINARDAMPTGGVLTIQTASADLTEEVTGARMAMTPGRYIMLAVADTGCGMDSATKAQIFEPFFTTKEVGKGTGLGLATVYGIVKQSGGFIWVYSELGLGTTFKVYLPRVDAPVDAQLVTARTPVRGGDETVLVVEDDAAVRVVVQQILKHHGYRVFEAVTPGEALDLVRRLEEPIHMVLTDLVMPQLSGREIAQRLHEMRPGLPVMYMSGYTDGTAVRHGSLDEGSAFIEKPFTADSLASKVREVLDAAAETTGAGARGCPPRLKPLGMPRPFVERRRAGLRGMDGPWRVAVESRTARPTPAPTDLSAGGARGEVILLVEDDTTVRGVMTRTLDTLGYAVLPAADGDEALAIAMEYRGTLNLLVTDVRMPKTSGPEVVRQIKAARPGIGVLYVSGESWERLRHSGLVPSDAAFLAKPFPIATLGAKVREVLDGSRRRTVPD